MKERSRVWTRVFCRNGQMAAALWKLVCVRELFLLLVRVLNALLASGKEQDESIEAHASCSRRRSARCGAHLGHGGGQMAIWPR